MAEQEQTAGTAAIKGCPKCSTKMKITAALRGKRIKCPGCSILLKISDDGEVSVPVMTTFINAKVCPECSTRMRITENLFSKKIKCPKCTTLLQISDTGEVGLVKPSEPEKKEEQVTKEKQVDELKKEPEKQKPEAEESQIDEDDEQLTVGDEDEQELPEKKEEEKPKIVLRPPEKEEKPEVKFEERFMERPADKPAFKFEMKDETRDTAMFLSKEIPVKHFNVLFYLSFFIAVFLLLIIIIDIATGFNVITSPIHGSKAAEPVKNKSVQPVKEKTEYEMTLEIAENAKNCLIKADSGRKDLEAWADIDKKGGLLVEYNNGIRNYLEAQKGAYKLSINNIKKQGYPDGDILRNAEDGLNKALMVCRNYYLMARIDKELNYIFNDSLIQDSFDYMMKTRDEYTDLVTEKSIDDVEFDSLMEFENNIFTANDLRVSILHVLEKYFKEFKECPPESSNIMKFKSILENAAKKYFINGWTTLEECYKYTIYAKENELAAEPFVNEMVDRIEDDSFRDIEDMLNETGISIDRNLAEAQEIRTRVETLKNEINGE